jgi:hypothetical protein
MFATLEKQIVLVACTLAGTVAYCLLLTVPYGLNDINFIQTYNSDEHNQIYLLQRNLTEAHLDPHGFFTYGYLYNSVIYVVLQILSWFKWNVDVKLIGITARTLSVLFGVLSCFSLYTLGKLVGLPRHVSVAAAVLFFTTPAFIDMSGQALADSLQTLLIQLAFIIVLLRADYIHAVSAAALAGLAFGTKYASGFLLPFCAMPYALSILVSRTSTSIKMRQLFFLYLSILAAFVALFAVTNPYTISNFTDVFRTLMVQAEWMTIGHGKVEPINPVNWLPVIATEISWIGVLLLFIGTVLGARQIIIAWRTAGYRNLAANDVWRNKITIFVYLLITIAYLALSVRLRHSRYLFHVLPFWIVFSLAGIWKVYSSELHTKLIRYFLAAVIAGLLIRITDQARINVGALASATMRPLAPAVEAAKFMSDQYADDTRILAERYSYIPQRFKETKMVWAWSEAELRAFAPEVIVLHRRMSGRWIWKAPSTKFLERRFVVDSTYGTKPNEVRAFWDRLLAEGWRVTYESDEIVILEHSAFRPRQ